MTTRSKGTRYGTRKKLKRTYRTPITRHLQSFDIGEQVVILPDSSSSQGMPFPRFKGLTGSIKGKRGRAYIISIKEGKKRKCLMITSEHIKKLRR